MVVRMPVWWSFVALLAVVLSLAGCDSPSPRFAGLVARQVTVDGSQFSVRHTLYEAEAIRLSRELRPERGATVVKGAKAIVIASGCKLVPNTLNGDTNIVRADIACLGAPDRPWRRPGPIELDCGIVSGYGHGPFGTRDAEFECTVLR